MRERRACRPCCRWYRRPGRRLWARRPWRNADGLQHLVVVDPEIPFSRPETGRFNGSFTVTGISTRLAFTRISARRCSSIFGSGLGRGVMVTSCPRNSSGANNPSPAAKMAIPGSFIRLRKYWQSLRFVRDGSSRGQPWFPPPPPTGHLPALRVGQCLSPDEAGGMAAIKRTFQLRTAVNTASAEAASNASLGGRPAVLIKRLDHVIVLRQPLAQTEGKDDFTVRQVAEDFAGRSTCRAWAFARRLVRHESFPARLANAPRWPRSLPAADDRPGTLRRDSLPSISTSHPISILLPSTGAVVPVGAAGLLDGLRTGFSSGWRTGSGGFGKPAGRWPLSGQGERAGGQQARIHPTGVGKLAGRRGKDDFVTRVIERRLRSAEPLRIQPGPDT